MPFSPSCRLVRDLGPVVEVVALPMLDARQDFTLGGSVAAQLVGDNYPRHVWQAAQQLAEEPLGRLDIAPALHEDVEHMAALVDNT
jgi:hypothetical protein